MIKAALTMVLYAIAMLVVGVVAYLVAPSGASAATALISPAICGGLMMTCAVLTILGAASGRDGKGISKLGVVGVHLGILLPLLFTLAFTFRALPATGAYLDAKRALNSDSAIEQATAILDEKQSKAYKKDYLVVALWSLTAISGLAFGSMLSQRPKIEKRAKEPAGDSNS